MPKYIWWWCTLAYILLQQVDVTVKLHAKSCKCYGRNQPESNNDITTAIWGRTFCQIKDAKCRSSIYLIIYSPLGMKYPHASSSITRDYGSFDGSCGTSLSSCAQTFLPRRLSHSVSHTLFIIFIDLERGGWSKNVQFWSLIFISSLFVLVWDFCSPLLFSWTLFLVFPPLGLLYLREWRWQQVELFLLCLIHQ